MAASIKPPLPLSDALAPLGQLTPPPAAPMGAGAPPPMMAPEPPPLPEGWTPIDNGMISKIQPDGRTLFGYPNPNVPPEGVQIVHISDPPKVPKERAEQQQAQGIPLSMQAPAPR